MTALKSLAPKYRLGVLSGAHPHRNRGDDAPSSFDTGSACRRGAALTSAITTEAVGYVVLLIPRRIREIKEEGRAEAMREWRAEGRKEEAERIARLRARCERGEITLDEFFERVSNGHCDVCHR